VAKQSELEYDLGAEFQAAYDALRTERVTWDDKEALLLGKRIDKISNNRKSQVTDGALGNLQWERAARVMAQLPTGKIQASSKKDLGKNTLMNIVMNRYVLPNANAQYAHLIKLRLWDIYSRAWGAAPMLYDYRVDDEYIGPDSWLINIRDFFPQPGKTTIQDCDWVMISTIVNVAWLEDKLDREGWEKDSIKKIITSAKEGTRPSKKDDAERVSSHSMLRNETSGQKGKFAEVELITMYQRGEKGRWITFAPDYDDQVVRNIPNPHKNGRIPVVLKQNFPRVDSIIGLSDVERGETLQKAKDSLINLYLDGVKMSIFPPLKISTSGVRMSSIVNAPAAKWLMDDLGKVQQHQISPQGFNSFVSTYQFLHGAQLSLNGTTDARVSGENSGSDMGKTPAAIKQAEARENARDNWDRFMMEKAIEELYEGFINLISEKQEKPIPIDIFEEEVKQLMANGMEDVGEIYESGKAGKLIVNKRDIKSKYTYNIDAGTTMANDDKAELDALLQTFELLSQIPPEILQQSGKRWEAAEHLEKILIKSGINDWEKILTEAPEEEEMEMDPMTGQPLDPQQQQGPDPLGIIDQTEAETRAVMEQFLGGGQQLQPQAPMMQGGQIV
jgi:hypothetical protein